MTMTTNKDETQKRLFKWMKNVRPLVKWNATSPPMFDAYLLEELDELIEILEKDKGDDSK
jgi:hypothetical protein